MVKGSENKEQNQTLLNKIKLIATEEDEDIFFDNENIQQNNKRKKLRQ